MRAPLTLLVLALLVAPAAAQVPPSLPAPLPVPVGSDVAGAAVYPAWPVLTLEMQQLAAQHPDIARLHSAGKSSVGLDLWVMEIADFENPARVPLGHREVLWVDGGTHANEYSGVMFVTHLLKFLLRGYGENETATWIVENRHTLIMPLLNPEGSLNGVGRLNDRLVNINRNYPVGWGDLDEGFPFNNPGPYAASEPETQAVVKWWKDLQPDYMASIHCCGNLWLYPYGIEGRDPHPDDAPVLARICEEAYAEVREDCGPIWSTIYPASGSSVDTAYEVAGSAAFGFEMSGREALLLWGQPFTTSDIEETESESWRGILHAFLHVERYGAHPEVRVASVAPGEVRLTVRNDGWGNLTRGEVRLTDAQGIVQTADLPWLGPGQEAGVLVPGSFGAGSFPLQVAYGKRGLGGEGLQERVLQVTAASGSLAGTLEPLAPGEALPLRTTSQAGDAATPFPAGLALLALADAALLAIRGRD